ncbi:response regulator [Halothiobacillus sp. DCM-1]|uniref:response regulator n=1 Tax=Halothiobacillus sp. DCM-1 TaxID=3112558 RepID=UPI0032499FAC
MRILLVEDDRPLGAAVQQALRDAAYAVDWVQDGATAVLAATTEPYDLLLLDLGLPRQDGLSVLQTIRRQKTPTPVIILTARDGVADRIAGLDAGADDYLIKPFMLDELFARIRAVVRRHHGHAQPLIETADLILDPAARTLSRAGQVHPLTAREFALIHALMQRAGHVLSREALETHIYGWDEEVSSNSVEVLIHGLRRKLGKEAIKNVRGLGWMVAP